jgi:hypothetical protein
MANKWDTMDNSFIVENIVNITQVKKTILS